MSNMIIKLIRYYYLTDFYSNTSIRYNPSLQKIQAIFSFYEELHEDYESNNYI